MQTLWGYKQSQQDGFAIVTENGARVTVELEDGVSADALPDDGKIVALEGEVIEHQFSTEEKDYRTGARAFPKTFRARAVFVDNDAYQRIAASSEVNSMKEVDYVDPFETIDAVSLPLLDDQGAPRNATDITTRALRNYPGVFFPVAALLLCVGAAALNVRLWRWNPTGLELMQGLSYAMMWLATLLAIRAQVRPPPVFFRNQPLGRITTVVYIPLVWSALALALPFVIDLDAGIVGSLIVVGINGGIIANYRWAERHRGAVAVSHLRELVRAPQSPAFADGVVGAWAGTVVDPTPARVGGEDIAVGRTHDSVIEKRVKPDAVNKDGEPVFEEFRHEFSRFQALDTFLVDTEHGTIEVDPTDIVWTSSYAIRGRVLTDNEVYLSQVDEPFRHCVIPVGGRAIVYGELTQSDDDSWWLYANENSSGHGPAPPFVLGGGDTSALQQYAREAVRTRAFTIAGLTALLAIYPVVCLALLVT